jgi:hypothetical protein
MKTRPKSPKNGPCFTLVPPLDDGHNWQRVIFQKMCMHAGSPIPQNTCFIFQKRSESGPCEKTTLTKTEVALLGVLGALFLAHFWIPEKQGTH